jgi:hypothetical protein
MAGTATHEIQSEAVEVTKLHAVHLPSSRTLHADQGIWPSPLYVPTAAAAAAVHAVLQLHNAAMLAAALPPVEPSLKLCTAQARPAAAAGHCHCCSCA